MTSPASRRRALWTMVAALGVLHVAPIPLPRGVVLGFLPWDLAFHLAWMLGAACVVVYMTDRVWPDDVRAREHPKDGGRS